MWAVSDWLLSRLDSSSVIVFLLVFLVGYYWFMTTPSNLPPGPRALPVLGNMLAVRAALPNLLDQMHEWRKEHGDIFTLKLGGKLMVVISSYKLLHETFVKRGDVFSGRPRNLHTINQVIGRIGTGVIFNEGPPWKELRRVTLMAMRDFGLGKKSLEQRVQDEARAVMEVMDKNRGVAMTMKPLLAKFSANVICSVIFGDRLDLSVLGQDRLVTMEDRKDLPYIEAVVTEILRLVPIAPLGVPHVLVKETELAGYTLPADTIVLSNINEMHHDPAVWPDPHLFKPDRFLDKGGHFCPPKENYLPFSIGPRVCLGEVLARMEVFILFTTLLQYFTFTMGHGQKPDLLGQMGITQTPKCQAVFATRRC